MVSTLRRVSWAVQAISLSTYRQAVLLVLSRVRGGKATTGCAAAMLHYDAAVLGCGTGLGEAIQELLFRAYIHVLDRYTGVKTWPSLIYISI
jgi:hypothetical protein